VVPTEGNEGENPEDTKTQVILQLQPVQQGWVASNLAIPDSCYCEVERMGSRSCTVL
jgi:hypothetical protein